MRAACHSSHMAKRTYTSTVRASAARETRAAILRAAKELFVEQGYAQSKISGIAERAGVALNTVYASVGGKASLVEALADEGTGDEEIAAALAAVHASADAREVLRLTARSTGETTRRHEPVLNLLADNATADPAVAAVAERVVRHYRERLNKVAEHVSTLRAVQTDTTTTEQILWFYFGQEAWRTVRGFGWSWADSAAWLTEQAAHALLPPSAEERTE